MGSTNQCGTGGGLLSEQAVLAFWDCGIFDSAVIARCLKVDPRLMEVFCQNLSGVEYEGLVSVLIPVRENRKKKKSKPIPVYCGFCHARLLWVPCRACRIRRLKREAPSREVRVRRALPEPTDARPGSPEKIEILRQRWDQGVALWHPDDPTAFVY